MQHTPETPEPANKPTSLEPNQLSLACQRDGDILIGPATQITFPVALRERATTRVSFVWTEHRTNDDDQRSAPPTKGSKHDTEPQFNH